MIDERDDTDLGDFFRVATMVHLKMYTRTELVHRMLTPFLPILHRSRASNEMTGVMYECCTMQVLGIVFPFRKLF